MAAAGVATGQETGRVELHVGSIRGDLDVSFARLAHVISEAALPVPRPGAELPAPA